MPGITARICGICPISHLIASSKACDATSEAMVNRVSAVVRAYDPCLSCSTHANGSAPRTSACWVVKGRLLDELHTD
jgi:coenzyme F420-reducing hydrogenase alpha subunit